MITIGTTAFTRQRLAAHVAPIARNPATIMAMARTQSELPLVMMGTGIKSASRLEQNGLVVETWSRGMALRRVTRNAWNFSSRLIPAEARHYRVIPLWPGML